MINDKLKIILITYNRINSFSSTLEQILSEDSPIKDYDITILNNASTDGTDDVILEYQKSFPNLKHIRNQINIGGNANICRAFEMAATSGKEYAWILCDDDVYDFSNWCEVEKCVEEKVDIICLSDYVFPSNKYKCSRAYQMFQLTFVPACIFKTSNIDDKVLFNMYESTFSMFQQLALPISLINKGENIHVLSKPIVFNGLHFENKRENRSYIRGTTKTMITERRKNTNWILGFSNIISLIDDPKLQKECLEVSIPYVDIYGSWRNFYGSMDKEFFNIKKFNYFYEVYKCLRLRRKIEFWIYKSVCFIPILHSVPAFIKSLRIYFIITFHNLKGHFHC